MNASDASIKEWLDKADHDLGSVITRNRSGFQGFCDYGYWIRKIIIGGW